MKIYFSILMLLSLLMSCAKDKPTDSGNGGTGVEPPVVPPPPVVRPKNFYVEGKVLRDSSGKEFIIRGNNIPVFWFPTQYKPSIAAVASLGGNTLRLVWQLQKEAWTPALSVLEDAIKTTIANKMVAIVELHDYTGGTNPAQLTTAASYYASSDVKKILDKYTHALIINIANEWGDNNVTDVAWKNAYIPAIKILRDAGYKVPIMIDAPGWGQRETAIVTQGKELLNADSLKNIIFSPHAYSLWNNSSTYNSRINAMLNQNLCITFGEFGWNVPDNQQPAGFECKVDAALLMKLCQEKKVGYLGWSWTGNNQDNACFDMSTSWSDTSKLTDWGRQWAYDANGIKNTGKKASIF